MLKKREKEEKASWGGWEGRRKKGRKEENRGMKEQNKDNFFWLEH